MTINLAMQLLLFIMLRFIVTIKLKLIIWRLRGDKGLADPTRQQQEEIQSRITVVLYSTHIAHITQYYKKINGLYFTAGHIILCRAIATLCCRIEFQQKMGEGLHQRIQGIHKQWHSCSSLVTNNILLMHCSITNWL